MEDNKVVLMHNGEVISSDSYICYIDNGSLDGELFVYCGLGTALAAQVMMEKYVHNKLLAIDDEDMRDTALDFRQKLAEVTA